jgi:hypothetical protein
MSDGNTPAESALTGAKVIAIVDHLDPEKDGLRRADSRRWRLLRDPGDTLVGGASILAWLTVFALGMLLNSAPFREDVSPKPPPPGSSEEMRTTWLRETANRPLPIRSLALAALTFAPINIGLLAIIAGFAGGCASRIAVRRRQSNEGPVFEAETDRDRKRLVFMTEHPIESSLRSFVVYLGVLAGIVIAAGNGAFETDKPDQYVRLAGGISAIAFVVGYDPTRFRDFLDLLPAPKGRGDQPVR